MTKSNGFARRNVNAAVAEVLIHQPRVADCCGAKLFPGDWLTRDGCCYCDRDEVLL